MRAILVHAGCGTSKRSRRSSHHCCALLSSSPSRRPRLPCPKDVSSRCSNIQRARDFSNDHCNRDRSAARENRPCKVASKAMRLWCWLLSLVFFFSLLFFLFLGLFCLVCCV